jgi:ribokinase
MPCTCSSRDGGHRYPRSRGTDLVVATPVFLDLTFVGLESLPALGEERFAADLVRSPGGGAITAVGAARLGLATAVAAPLGEDVGGELVRAALAEEQVDVIATRPAPRTPTNVVMPFGGSRAMVTVDPGVRASAADVAARAPRAVSTNLAMLHVVPPEATAYVTCGDDDARAFKGRPPAALACSRVFFVNRAEALARTGKPTVEQAAVVLRGLAETVVVSLGADGGLMATAGEMFATPAERVEKPVDTTGAGDLLAAAYIWADLRGAEPVDRLRWAVLYASLGVTTPTGIGGALDEAGLVEAGMTRGLNVPPLVGAARS